MLKQLLSAVAAVALVSHGIARAGEPVPPGVSIVRDREALVVHFEALEEGDHIAVATAEGVISGELVDKDADDVVIDQPLIQGGVERIAIPLREIQGVRYQSANPPQVRPSNKAWIITAVVVGALILVARLGLLAPGP